MNHPQTAREPVLVGLVAVAFALAFSYPVLGHLSEAGFRRDWDLLRQLDWAAFHSVTHFHQLPLWNPYKCGGMPLLANPHSRIVTPFFLLHLFLGPNVGLNLEVPLHLAIAWSGGYVLGRILGLGPRAAALSASVFPGSSWFYLHMAVGQVVYLPSLYLPWIAALTWFAIVRERLFFAGLAGALVALTLGEGGVYPAPQALLLVTLVALTVAISRRSFWPVVILLALGGFALGLAAIKLLPMEMLLRSHPRPVRIVESNPPGALWTALFSAQQAAFARGPGRWGFHEWGAYVGGLAGGLAVLGVVTSPRRALPWLVASLVFLSLVLGQNLGPWSPWSLLHHLPIFSSERVTPRFLIPCTLTLGVAAAIGVEWLERRLGRVGTIVATVLVGAVVVDLWAVGPAELRPMVEGRERSLSFSPTFRQSGDITAFLHMLPLSKANMGAVRCYEYVDFPSPVIGADQPGYRGEEYLVGRGSIRQLEWTPNALTYQVEVATPTVLVVNQNYDPGWRLADGGGEVVSENGLLAVRVPAGASRVKLVYRGRPFAIGVLVTGLTLVTLLTLWWVEQRRAGGHLRVK